MTQALASLPTREDQRAAFLARAGHEDASLIALPADASTRRYFRLDGAGLLLMDSPPHSEPIGPFVQVARHLQRLGLSAPALLQVDEEAGLALIEDFGHDTYTRLLASGYPERELYRLAVDALVSLHEAAPGAELPAYDAGQLSDECALFIDWYAPLLIGKDAALELRQSYLQQFAEAFADVAHRREALVLRDFHVDNLMLLPGREGVAACGLLDFQDALIGSAAYDLMSLLEDARRDISEGLRVALLSHYLVQRPQLDAPRFLDDYQRLAAQRHAKVLGIFVRLAGRDGKHGYLAHLPRTLGLFVRALNAEALAPLREWLDRHLPGWREPLPPATLAALRETLIDWFKDLPMATFNTDTASRFINAEFLPVTSERVRQVLDPATLQPVGHVGLCDEADVQAAIDAATAAQKQWRQVDAKSRAARLHQLANAIEQNVACNREVARLMTLEMGKPFPEAMGELANCAPIFRYYAEMARDDAGKVAGTTQIGSFQHVRYEPYGVSVHIMPFNFPILLMCWTVAASLAAGNACIVKPAEATTLCTLKFMEHFTTLLPGLVSCVPGDAVTAQLLVKSEGTHAVAFTGSVAAGQAVAVACAQQMKPCVIEAGGSDPLIISRHAPLEVAAAGAVTAAFHLSGQICTSAERFYVVDEIHDEFVARFAERTRALRIGHGLERSEIGPMVSEAARNKVMRLVDDALAKGATLVCGGRIPPQHSVGWFYEPTILTGVTADMAILQEECFGPVAAICRVSDFDEAVRLANDSPFGLGASLFSTDLAEAMEAADRLEAGMVWVNNPLIDNDALPFGGWKMSGLGRELGRQGLEAFRRSKMVIIDHQPKIQDWWYPYADDVFYRDPA